MKALRSFENIAVFRAGTSESQVAHESHLWAFTSSRREDLMMLWNTLITLCSCHACNSLRWMGGNSLYGTHAPLPLSLDNPASLVTLQHRAYGKQARHGAPCSPDDQSSLNRLGLKGWSQLSFFSSCSQTVLLRPLHLVLHQRLIVSPLDITGSLVWFLECELPLFAMGHMYICAPGMPERHCLVLLKGPKVYEYYVPKPSTYCNWQSTNCLGCSFSRKEWHGHGQSSLGFSGLINTSVDMYTVSNGGK